MKKLFLFSCILSLLFVCSKPDVKDAVVSVGKATISKEQFSAFEKISRMYPTDPGIYFPSYRPKISHCVDAEVLFQQKATRKIKNKIKHSDDWKWKQRYFPAQLFLVEFLVPNLGIPEEQLKEYYETHNDSFKVTIQRDSTKGGDSTYIRPFDDVKKKIADVLFLRDNRPDSAFLSRYDSLPAQEDLNDQWLQYIQKNLPNFFMKKLYTEVTNTPFPDSTSELIGEGKMLSQADVDVIMGWIPEARHNYYSTPERKRELIEWLLKWKLFSDKAAETGFTQRSLVKNVLDWAWKLNVVYAYVNDVLVPEVKSSVTVDTAMLMYAVFDDNGYKPLKKGSSLLDNKIKTEFKDVTARKIDSIIVSLRQKIRVTFHQNDWKDDKNENPADLLTKADALRDSGKTPEAKRTYQSLSKDFPCFPEGQSSLIELAKLQTEQQQYTQAIKNYRKFLLLSSDTSRRCNTFFMIGFIYDEYLDKPRHAEANYKWVLRNTPGCELADDAEFMMLHLDEPMTSVEELRAEADRQGRKVEDDEIPAETGEEDPDSAAAETAS